MATRYCGELAAKILAEVKAECNPSEALVVLGLVLLGIYDDGVKQHYAFDKFIEAFFDALREQHEFDEASYQ